MKYTRTPLIRPTSVHENLVVLTGFSNEKITGLLQFGPQKNGRNNGVVIVWRGSTVVTNVNCFVNFWHGKISIINSRQEKIIISYLPSKKKLSVRAT